VNTLAAVRGGCHKPHVGLAIDNRGDALAQQGVIVDTQDSYPDSLVRIRHTVHLTSSFDRGYGIMVKT
jgi:hypothetical protein